MSFDDTIPQHLASDLPLRLVGAEIAADDLPDGLARIRVVGVGGAGGNAINHMIAAGLGHVDFVALNTDAQALGRVRADRALRLGEKVTRGLGAGGNPTIGARAAEESAAAIAETLAGTDLVFVTMGLGGGTGTGAGPIVARIAREQGALVVGVVTLPFTFEGRKRGAAAMIGLEAMRQQVDTLITIPNDRLFTSANPDITLQDAFRAADDVLRQGVAGLADLITVPGLINLDFADLRAVMANAGTALMSIGEAEGPDRARLAAQLALGSPLLGLRVHGARGVVFSVSGGETTTLADVQAGAEIIGSAAHPDATIIFGAVTDHELSGAIKVTVVATGFDPAVFDARYAPAGRMSGVTRTPTAPLPERQPTPASGLHSPWQPAPGSETFESDTINELTAVREVLRPRLDLTPPPTPPSLVPTAREAHRREPASVPSYLRRLWR